MNRYFFNFRHGGELARDAVGMYLPDLDAAHAEAVRTSADLSVLAEMSGEATWDCEIQVADASGEPVLAVPLTAAH